MSQEPSFKFVTLLEKVGFRVLQSGEKEIEIDARGGSLKISKEECRKHGGNFYRAPHFVFYSQGTSSQKGNHFLFVFSGVKATFKGETGFLCVLFSEWNDGSMTYSEDGNIGIVKTIPSDWEIERN